MCNKNPKRSTKTKNKNPQPQRPRSRPKKPKYLSLSKHMTETNPTSPKPEQSEIPKMPRQLKNLFPLHPETQISDADRDDNVALLFHSSDAADLSSLLETTPQSTSSVSFRFDENDEVERRKQRSLVESAMKRSHRDSEERWVCYSEVVENDGKKSVVWRSGKRKKRRKRKSDVADETTSCSGNSVVSNCNSERNSSKRLSLALKLDYQGILNAWSDKGSLFIQGDQDSSSSPPQTVPDLQSDLGLMDSWGSSVGNLWQVPESGGLKIKEEMELGKDGWKLGQREASVLRYKEKRQSRLFSKRIRYEVRKLNAEKRPRMKGRFVKIS